MAIDTTLGSSLYRWYTNYSSTATAGGTGNGTWTCAVGSGNAVHATRAPAAEVLPSGATYPNFTATNDFLEITSFPSFPTYNAAHNYCFGLLLRIDVSQSGTAGFILGVSSNNYYYTGSALNIINATSNNNLADGNWHRIIAVKNGANPLTLYVDGVAQTTTSTGALGQNWDGLVFGDRFADAGYNISGGMASPFFAYSATTPFDSTIISALDTDLDDYLNVASGGGDEEIESTITNNSTVSGTITAIGSLALTIEGSATVEGTEDSTLPLFDLPARTLSIWHNDYAGSPWAGKTSAGVSGTTTSSEATNAPSIGSSLNGHPTADFDGTNDRLIPSISAATALGSSGWFIDTVIQFDTLHVGSEFDHPFARPGILAADAFWGIHVSQWGFEWFQYTSGGAFNKGMISEVTPTTGVWYHIQVRWSGTEISGRVTIAGNETGAWSTPYSLTSIAGSLGNLRIGQNNGASAHIDGRMAHIIVEPGVVTDEVADLYGSYAQSEYDLDWGFEELAGEPEPAIITVLGSRLKLGFFGDYASGTWNSTVAGDELLNTNPDNQPILGTTPGGNPVLVFDGNDTLDDQESTNNRLDALAAFPAVSNYQRLFACIYRRTEILPDTYSEIFGSNSTGIIVSPYSGAIIVSNNDGGYTQIQSDDSISDGEWYRIIVVSDDTNTLTEMYINGIAQSETMNRIIGIPGFDWGNGWSAIAGGGHVGEIGAMVFAHTEAGATFTDISAIDAALQEYIEGSGTPPPEGEIEANVANTSDVSATIIAIGSLSSTIANISDITSSINGNSSTSVTVSNTSTVTANINGYYAATSTVLGEAATTAGILATGSLATSIENSANVTANITGVASISAIIECGAGVQATSSVISNLSSIVTGNSATTGVIQGFGSISTAIEGIAELSSSIIGVTSTSSTVTATSSTIANIEALGYLSTTINGASLVNAGLGGERLVSATIENTSSISASLNASGQLSSMVVNTSDVEVNGFGIGNIASTLPGTSSIEGAFDDIEYTSIITGVSIITGNISGVGNISAAISSNANVSSNIIGVIASNAIITGTSEVNISPNANVCITGDSAVSAQVVGTGKLELEINSQSSLQANLQGIVQISASIAGSSTIQGSVIGRTGFTTLIESNSAVLATALGIGSISTQVPGTSSNNFAITGYASLQSAISCSSSINAQVNGIVSSNTLIDAGATCSSELFGNGYVISSIANTSTASASISATTTLSAEINGSAGYSFTLDGRTFIQAIIVNSALVNGLLFGASNGNVMLPGYSEIISDIEGYLNTNIQIGGLGNLSVGIYDMQAVLTGISTINGYIYNYLQDKKIITLDKVERSGGFIPTSLIPVKIKPTPPPPPPPPDPDPDPPAHELPIKRSGDKLGTIVPPNRINKSNRPI